MPTSTGFFDEERTDAVVFVHAGEGNVRGNPLVGVTSVEGIKPLRGHR